MCFHFREESAELRVIGRIVFNQHVLRTVHGSTVERPTRQPGQRSSEPIDAGIGGEPVALYHEAEHVARAIGHEGVVLPQQVIHATVVYVEWPEAFDGPMAGEQVIIEQVEHDTRVLAGVGTQAFAAREIQLALKFIF